MEGAQEGAKGRGAGRGVSKGKGASSKSTADMRVLDAKDEALRNRSNRLRCALAQLVVCEWYASGSKPA